MVVTVDMFGLRIGLRREQMEANFDLLRNVDTGQPRVSFARLSVVVLAIAALLAVGLRLETSNAANASVGVGSVAYCVTMEGQPADAGLKAGLYSVGDNQLSRYASGATDHNGCGVFNYVPVGENFFVSVWSSDGTEVGNSAWFEADAMTIAPTVQLDTPGFFNRLALH
jgi:hypothetical protein